MLIRSSKAAKPKKAKKKEKNKLSFAMDDEEEDAVAGPSSGVKRSQDDAEGSNDAIKKAKFTKNPAVDTSFLPDREREQREAIEREELRKEWIAKQEKMKKEEIEVTYSYWDGSGHRKSVDVSYSPVAQQLTSFSVRRATTSLPSCRNVVASSQS
jgi:protein FAM50